MGAVEDLWKSAQDSIRERLDSPLLVAFAVSWSLWNYKFLMILFSENGVTKTLHLVDTVAYPNCLSLVLHAFLGTAGSAALFIWLYPLAALRVFAYLRRQQLRQNEVRRAMDNETLLTKEESAAIRRKEMELQAKLWEMEDEVFALREAARTARNGATTTENPPRVNKLAASTAPLSPVMVEVLNLFATLPDPLTEDDVTSFLSETPRLEVLYALGELTRLSLVRQEPTGRGGLVYRITHEGRGRVIEASRNRSAS